MLKKQWGWMMVLFIAFQYNYTARGGVAIDSLKTTTSTCINNGSITVFASTTTGSLLFAIIAGPVTLPIQTNPVFTSLPPGNYTIEVSNTLGEKQTANATVTGNYQLPDFVPTVNVPFCATDSSGSIAGNLTAQTGLAPFTWALVSPSPIVRPPQASDTFFNLPNGSYTVQVQDACNNIQTKVVIMLKPPNSISYQGHNVLVTGCDTALFWLLLSASDLRPPYKATYDVAGVPYSIDTAALLSATGAAVQLELPAYNTTYGGFATNITVTDKCGATVTVPRLDVCPFNFWQTYTTISAAGCGIRLLTKFVVGDETGCTGVTPKFPFSISIRDVPGNNLLETKTYNSYLDGEFSSVVMEPGKTYEITITDGCNRSLTKIINTPPLRKEVRVSVNPMQTMLDSTAIVYFYAYGFPSVGTTFTITGGPAAAFSTKKGYTYHEAYVYPKSFAMVVSSDSSMQAAVNNMAPGKYYFNITDSCGNIYSDSCVVGTHEVSNFYIKSAYSTGCSGQAGISYDFLHNTFTTFNVINNATKANVFTLSAFQMQNMPNPNMGVVNNLSATSYTLSLTYYGVGGSLQSLTNVLADSFVVKDTLVILPYQNPRFQTNAVVFCNGSFVLILTADSTKGIPPYRYEIIGGPQLFPPQSSNVFQMGTPGIYTIRLLDSCNNSTTANVTVDSIVFPPINKIGSSCINGSVKLTYGRSPYFTYSWTLPNGTSFNGDTLTISPVTAADTGLYRIRRTTTINGCLNTDDTVYRLQAGLKDSTSRTICEGAAVSFGNRMLTQSGIYADTISTSLCDSISILNLTVLPLKKDSINRQICTGESFLFNGNLISTTGVYRDTIATSSCDSIVILRLEVNPLKQDSAVVSICPGQQVNFGGRVLSVPGVYRDTLATTGCDSISVLNLLLSPAKRDSAVASICQNEEFAFGNSILNQPGIYRDTFATTGCDSIAVLNLIVHPLPVVSIAAANNPAVIGTIVQLTALPSSLDAYNWESTNPLTNPLVYNPQTKANAEAWYKVQVTDANGCTTTDSLLLRVIPDTVLLTCNNTPIFIANAFSPNGDGRNDVFRISSLLPTAVRHFTLAIYNRWGEKIFESNSPATFWDGSYLGKPASVGNYVYMLRFDCGEGRKIFHKGNIALLR